MGCRYGPAMRNIFIVTHPEATHAAEGLVGGWYDSSLTDHGAHDAERIADRLVTLMPGVGAVQLATSDLSRAQQTAAPIGRAFGLSPVIDSDLRERSYGDAEGRAPGTTVFLPPPLNSGRMDHHPGTPGTETRREWAARKEDDFAHDRAVVALNDCAHLNALAP